MIQNISNTLPDYNKFYLQNTRKYNNVNIQNCEQKPLSKIQKSIILTSSAIGAMPVIAFLAKRKGFSLNPLNILKTPIKDWALFKYKPLDKVITFEDPEPILATAAGSIAGGFIGGSIVDKDNIKAKKREVLNQMLGDVIVPIGCVYAGAKIFQKFENKIVNIMPTVNNTKKFAKIINTISKNLPNTIATIIPLGIGIIAGNKVSNFINEKLYHKEVDRNIRITDFAPHVDDLCMSVSMVNSGSEFASKLARVIPLALLVPGYETGTAREK